MRRILIFIFVFAFLLIPSFASFGEENNFDSEPTFSFSASDFSSFFQENYVVSSDDFDFNSASLIDISVSPLYNLDSGVTTIPPGSLKSVLNSIIGPYSPVVVQYQYTNGTNTQYLREILPDYQWMISVAVFSLVLYCVFRLWGAILCKR